MNEIFKANAKLILQCLAVLWAIEIVNFFLGHRLSALGIMPRSFSGLLGIPLSPFLHGNLYHLMVNTLPFAILGSFVMLQGRKTFIEVSLLVIVLGGIGVWLFGRSAIHVGASGVVFGYFGFLLMHGWYNRNSSALLIALLTVFLYGGMIWGVVPRYVPVSWEAHLFGLLAGALAARLKVEDKNAQLVKA